MSIPLLSLGLRINISVTGVGAYGSMEKSVWIALVLIVALGVGALTFISITGVKVLLP